MCFGIRAIIRDLASIVLKTKSHKIDSRCFHISNVHRCQRPRGAS